MAERSFKRRSARLYDVESVPDEPGIAAPSSPTEGRTVSAEGRTASAEEVVRRYALWSAGVGVIPFPLVDLVGMTALSVKMLRELSALYEVDFAEQQAKAYIAGLLSFVAPASLLTTLGRAFRFVPAVGLVLGPAAGWASTWAVGKVFIQHFELGGTLLDFDPEAMRATYEEKLAAAQRAEPS